MADFDPKSPSRRQLLSTLLFGTGVALVPGALLVPARALAGDLVVIVHPSVKESPAKSDLSLIFTTRKQEWSGGRPIMPFNFPPKHECRVAFDSVVLGMDADEVAKYWIDRRIRGGNAPPKQVPSAAMIVKLVEKFEGSIGYVPKAAAAGAGVRVVTGL